MSYKIEIQNNFFVVTDTTTGIEEIREVRDQVKWRVSGSIYSFFYNIANLIDQNSPNIIRLGENAKEFDFSEIVDSTETPFASRAIFNDLLNVNLGFMIRETSSVWGLITGDINDQTDLQTILNGKFDVPTGDTTQYIAGDGTLITFPVAGQAGTLVREVRNTTGATLTKGTVVYINGANGNKPTVAKAQANAESTSARTFGLLQSNIANNSNGFVVVIGDLTGLDTSAIAEGTQLYLSSTVAGEYTTTKQVAPAHMVYVGKVTRSHPTLGQIEVYIQNGFELDELHDVLISGETDGQVLQFEGASGLWKNKTLATGLTVGSTAISSGTDGRVLFQNGGVLQQSSALSFASGTFKVISNGAVNSVSVRNSLDTFDIFSISNGGAVLSSFLQVNGGLSSNIQFTATNNSRWVKMTHDFGQLEFTNSLGNNTFTLGNNGVSSFSGNVNIGGGTNGARLDVKAQGALSTDSVFRIRNSANTLDLIRSNGAGDVFLGLGAGNSNSGTNNVAYGIYALYGTGNGSNNTAIGKSSMQTNTSGGANTAIGSNSLFSNSTGSYNTAIAEGALRSNVSGNNNVGIGIYTLLANGTGSDNTAIGQSAGRFIADGSTGNADPNNSIFLGSNSKALASNQTNQIVIGHNAIGLGSNTAVIGNSSTTLFRPFGNVAIGADTAGARLDVRAQGALSTDNVFRIRNSANTADFLKIAGNGNLTYNAQGGGISLLNNDGTTEIGSTGGSATRINLLANSNNTININVAGTIGTIFNAARGGASGETAFLFNASIGNLAGTTNYGKIINIKDGRTDLGNRANTVVGLLIKRDATNTNTLLNVQALSATDGNVGFGVLINNASAKVQIDSTTQGFLPPRMTNAQRIAIASPAVGLMVYCTDAVEGLYIYKSMGWTFVI
jgi:hypothetical protein